MKAFLIDGPFFIYHFVVITLDGFFKLVKRFFTWLWYKIRTRLSHNEQLFLLFLLLLSVLLLTRWRSYEMVYNSQLVFDHGITTDDFLLYVIFLGISFLPALVQLFPANDQNSQVKYLYLLRITGLGLTTFYYLLTLVDPSRIAATTEASFTWQFFLFGLLLIAGWITGIPGIRDYAQNSFKNSTAL